MGFGRDDRPREMHKATCGDCGNECQIPFEPKDGRPVYCNECFPKHKPARSDRGGGRFGRGGGSRFGGRGGGRFGGRNDRGGGRFGGRNDRGGGRFGDRRPREMHDATCGDCGNECKIPFEPKDGRPVYCNECFPNHRNQRRD